MISPARIGGISALARDYMLREPQALSFFAADYGDAAAWPQRAEVIAGARRADRGRVVALLAAQNERLGAGARTMAHLEALARPEALVIVTGQQAGIFGGPLYTLYKALTTCRLAQYWSQRLARPVVPVFYVVSEDHDFAEVQGAGFLDAAHQLRITRYEPALLPERIPVGEVVLDATIAAPLAELVAAVPDGEFKSELVTLLAGCYQQGRPWAEAFARWYALLLHDYGMIFLDPADPGLKQLAAPIFARELEEQATVEAMLRVNARLTALGYHIQLPVLSQRPNLMLLRDGRHGLERQGQCRWRNLGNGESITLAELLAAPEQLSPKAGLRPLVEDWWLPTLAYVGGPGEIAYWAQLHESYRALSLPMPFVVPRAGFTLVEPRIRRILEKFAVRAETLVTAPEETLAALRESLVPAELGAEFTGMRQQIQERWPLLEQAIAGLDPTLMAPLEKTRQQMLHAFAQLEGKVVRAAEQRQATAQQQLAALGQALLPGGVLQERQLNVAPLLFRHGRPLLEQLYDSIDAAAPAHQVLNL